MPETPSFLKIQNKNSKKRYSISTLIKDSNTRKNLFIVFGLASCWGILYQILFIWMPTYLTHVQHYNNAVALQVNSIFITCLACLFLCVGYFTDFIKRKLILKSSCIAMIILAYPLFEMLSSGSIYQVYIAMSIFTFIFSLFIPTVFVSMVESFDTEIRYTGLSLSFNIGLAIFGGTCPLIATWLIEITENNSSPAFYMIFAAICALLLSAYIIEKRGQPI